MRGARWALAGALFLGGAAALWLGAMSWRYAGLDLGALSSDASGEIARIHRRESRPEGDEREAAALAQNLASAQRRNGVLLGFAGLVVAGAGVALALATRRAARDRRP